MDSQKIVNRFLFMITQYSNEKLIIELKKKDLLSKAFESRYLLGNTETSFIITDFVEVADNYNVAYLEETKEKSPYRIEIIKVNDVWKIQSFMFQCVGCFGEDENCGVCGGSGWGVL